MDVQIEPHWKAKLDETFREPYFSELSDFVREAYRTSRVFPAPKAIFRAFDLCPFPRVRVVILGQDPYHGVGQAHGLSFSVNRGVPIPPSLGNIFKEVADDVGVARASHGDLTRWAEQGVLLLNATLTVAHGQPGSHQKKGWERFTDKVIQILAEEREDIVFMLWGAYAKKKQAFIDPFRHLVLTAPHPSPFSAHSGFFGCRHFSQANAFLASRGLEPITW